MVVDEPTLTQLSEASIERERLKSLINSMADGVVATDEAVRRVARANLRRRRDAVESRRRRSRLDF